MVRVSGPMALEAVPVVDGVLTRTRGVQRVVLRLAGHAGVTLPALVMVFPGPASYTGQDCAEVSFAGSPFIAERLVAAMIARPGVRAAQPGEFTARAFLHGRLTLDRAEGVAAVIAAQSEEQLAAAREVLSGRAGEEYRRWADECTTMLALVEAGIDFTDQEDVVAIAPEQLRDRALALAGAVGGLLGARAGAEEARTLPVVALAGAPNAGKSTLFNALLGRERAVTGPVAGTTRDVLEEELELAADVPGAGRVLLQDLAGLSENALGISDREAQRAAGRVIGRADVVLWCDPSGRFDEAALPGAEPGRRRRVVRVRTFGDQPGAGREGEIAVCALDRWNLGALRRAIADQACVAHAAGVAALLPRHRRAMAAAYAHLVAAAQGAGTAEIAATSLRGALDELSQLVGAISPDDVIGRVFSLFCVGK